MLVDDVGDDVSENPTGLLAREGVGDRKGFLTDEVSVDELLLVDAALSGLLLFGISLDRVRRLGRRDKALRAASGGGALRRGR